MLSDKKAGILKCIEDADVAVSWYFYVGNAGGDTEMCDICSALGKPIKTHRHFIIGEYESSYFSPDHRFEPVLPGQEVTKSTVYKDLENINVSICEECSAKLAKPKKVALVLLCMLVGVSTLVLALSKLVFAAGDGVASVFFLLLCVSLLVLVYVAFSDPIGERAHAVAWRRMFTVDPTLIELLNEKEKRWLEGRSGKPPFHLRPKLGNKALLVPEPEHRKKLRREKKLR